MEVFLFARMSVRPNYFRYFMANRLAAPWGIGSVGDAYLYGIAPTTQFSLAFGVSYPGLTLIVYVFIDNMRSRRLCICDKIYVYFSTRDRVTKYNIMRRKRQHKDLNDYYKSIVVGCSTNPLKADSHCDPTAPSTTR